MTRHFLHGQYIGHVRFVQMGYTNAEFNERVASHRPLSADPALRSAGT